MFGLFFVLMLFVDGRLNALSNLHSSFLCDFAVVLFLI
jgi:hypothetical protein